MLDQADGQTYFTSGLVISKVAPRAYSDFEGTKSVRLKLDGVNVEWIGKKMLSALSGHAVSTERFKPPTRERAEPLA